MNKVIQKSKWSWKKITIYACIVSILVTHVFGDTIRFSKNRLFKEDVVLEENEVKFLGVKDGKIFYTKPYGFLGNRLYSINCDKVFHVLDDNGNEISYNCEVDTYKIGGNSKESGKLINLHDLG